MKKYLSKLEQEFFNNVPAEYDEKFTLPYSEINYKIYNSMVNLNSSLFDQSPISLK